MRVRGVLTALLAVAVIVGVSVQTAQPANALHGRIIGRVTNQTTGNPISNVCVTLGPPIRCWTATNTNGDYVVDLTGLGPDGQNWELYYLSTGYVTQNATYTVNGDTIANVALAPDPASSIPPTTTPPPDLVQPPPPSITTPPPSPGCTTADSRVPTTTVYLPNITKTLGGSDGWQTPFIIQNIGTAATDLETSFYRFDTGACVTRLTRAGLGAGTSQAYSPNALTALAADSQFAVVIRSFGSDVVSVVNQHQNTLNSTRAEALSYTGASTGAQTVYLPNIVRRFFGYVSPFIIQNLGSATANVSARFVSFDGTAPTVTVNRVIEGGRSKFVDPNSNDAILGAPGLMDGKQYAVTVTSAEPVAVVVNTHNDAPGTAQPVAYSANGLNAGSVNVYGPYAAKNAEGIGRLSTIVVQNLGATPVTPTLTFTALGGIGAPQVITAPAPIAAGASWAFDPRFTVGTTTPCTTASSTCLGDGEYSFVASSGSIEPIAAVVNVITANASSATAMGYAAAPAPSPRFFLPNVTRTLGGASGWTTPILLQSATASGAVVRWFRFSDGALVHTQTVTMANNSGMRIDPRTIPQLSDDTQYAVTIEGTAGNVAAIVVELASGGDNAMIYEGFPAPAP